MKRGLLIGFAVAALACAQITVIPDTGTPAIRGGGAIAIPRVAGGGGGTVTLGETTQNSSSSGIANAVFYSPIMTGNGSAGYTVSAIHTNIQVTASTTWGTAIYAMDPSTYAPTTKICSTVITSTPSVGDNILTPTGCGTLAANTGYLLAMVFSNVTVQPGIASGQVCDGFPLGVSGAIEGSAAFPATAPSVGYSNYCPTQKVDLTCVGTCGAVGAAVSVSFNAGTAGVVPTALTLQSSTAGCTTPALPSTSWAATGGGSDSVTYDATIATPFLTPKAVCGTTQTGTPSKGVRNDMSVAPPRNQYQYTFIAAPSPNKASIAHWFQTSLGTTSNYHDIGSGMQMVGGGGISIAYQSGALKLECFGGATNYSAATPISTNTLYWVTAQLDPTTGGTLSVYSASGVLLGGPSSCTSSGWTPSGASFYIVGGDQNATEAAGSYFYIDNLLINYISGALMAP